MSPSHLSGRNVNGSGKMVGSLCIKYADMPTGTCLIVLGLINNRCIEYQLCVPLVEWSNPCIPKPYRAKLEVNGASRRM